MSAPPDDPVAATPAPSEAPVAPEAAAETAGVDAVAAAEPAAAVGPQGKTNDKKSKQRAKRARRTPSVPQPPPDSERWFPVGAPRPRSAWVQREMRLTVQLLAVLVGVGMSAWASAKLVYNDHPPEGQRYKPAELNVLTNRPKNAAMEFHHSLCVLDFDRAASLALPAARALVDARRAACDAACLRNREDLAEQTLTRATLIEAKGREAKAFVECHGPGGKIDSAKYNVRLEGSSWKVLELAQEGVPATPEPTP